MADRRQPPIDIETSDRSTAARLVCFDLDGTLVDSHHDIATALSEAVGAIGRPPIVADHVKAMIGHGVQRLVQNATGIDDPVTLAELTELFGRAYRRCLVDQTRLYPGIAALLEALVNRGVVCVVATNKPARFTRAIAEALDFAGRGILGVASADETGARKPDPAVVRLAVERAKEQRPDLALPTIPLEPGAPRGTGLYVGDMAVDVLSARAANLPAVIVGWGFDPAGGRSLDPDHFVFEPAEILALI